MIYAIRHVTLYSYRSEVVNARCILYVQPRMEARQRILSSTLSTDPKPAERMDSVDFFGNRFVQLRFATLTPHHRFDARTKVSVEPAELPHALLTPPWEDIVRQAAAEPDLSSLAPAHFLFASRYVPILEDVRHYASRSFPSGRPILDAGLDLMHRIHTEFRYDSKATDISTPLQEVLEKRHGVCQDFAHLMIAGLRSLGLPAAYVSGYLRTYPAPGEPRLVGADATHAWVSLWCGPGFGWIDLDPTNAVAVGRDHIRLAVGRDYSDIAPAYGVVTASGGHRLDVSVDVAPLSGETA